MCKAHNMLHSDSNLQWGVTKTYLTFLYAFSTKSQINEFVSVFKLTAVLNRKMDDGSSREMPFLY